MTKTQIEQLSRFPSGQRVILARVKCNDWRGLTGEVQRVIKSRRMVRINVDRPPPGYQKTYDAYPENLDLE